MNKILGFIKNKYTILGVVAIAGAIFAFGNVNNVAYSESCPGNVPTTPVFNYWPLTFTPQLCHDGPLIDARDMNIDPSQRNGHYANSQAEHDAGITASVGDTVRVSIYFHNGATDDSGLRNQTTMHSVQFGTNFSAAATTDHTISGTLSASNAATVNSAGSQYGGNIVVHTTQPTTLQYVPGTTQVCIQKQAAIERGVNLSTAQTCGTDAQGQSRYFVNMPDGIANGSINWGDLKSCFPYSGFVIYSVTVIQQQNASLSITKQVKNITASDNSYNSSTNAHQNDTVQYKVVVTNTSSITAKSVNVTDNLPSGVQYVSGSLTVNGNSANDPTNIQFGDLTASQKITIIFNATVQVSSGTLTNTATATAINASSVQASATVNVQTVSQNGSMSITKNVRDNTRGDNSFANSITVPNGDTVEYQIVFTNTSNITLHGVVITDSIPSGLNYVQGSLNVKIGDVNINVNGDVNQLNIGSVTANQVLTIGFKEVVNQSSGTLTNTVTATATNASSVQASATVNVQNNTCTQPSLTIVKSVENLSQGSGGFANQVNANSGDHLAYQIVITDTSATANNVSILDHIPNYLNYISGSARMDGNQISDSFTNSPLNIGTMNSGSSHTIYFEANVSGSMPQGSTTITNTVNLTADCNINLSSSAVVTVNINTNNFAQLSITKYVRNLTVGDSFQKSTGAFTNDRVQYQIIVTNVGSVTTTNTRVSDTMPSGIIFNNLSVNYNGSNNNQSPNNIFLGSLGPGQRANITIDAMVNAQVGALLQNFANASADNAPNVSDNASVYVKGVAGSNIQLNLSKAAFNDTKNVDATTTPASKDDFISYTLTVTNNGNSVANGYIISDDLSSVLNYSTMTDTGGGTMNGNVITYMPTDIAPGSTMQRSFKVRVNFNLPAGNLTMVNTFGNIVTVQIGGGQVLGATFVAPTTGPEATYGFIFAGMLTAAFAVFKRKGLLKFIPKIISK